MALLPAFLLGLIGSFHCAGMCGPLALALPNPSSSRTGFWIGRLAYHAGRLGTYCALGLVSGLIGKSVALGGMQRWASIGLGLMLLFGLFGSKRLRFSNPASSLISRLKTNMSSLLLRRSFGSLLALGMLNGFLPCGLVYVAGTTATVQGGIVAAVAYMAAFGLGTLPMMLTLSLGARFLTVSVRLNLQRAIPVTVCFVALLLILRGMSLGVPYLSPDLTGSCCHESLGNGKHKR